MKLKLDELVDMFDEIQNYEYIVYNKKENNFREEYLKNMAIEWCQKNNIEYEE